MRRAALKDWLKDTFFFGTGTPALTSYALQTPKWPGTHRHLDAVFISDLHVGCPAVTPKRLEKVVAHINTMGADVILLGGDFTINERFNGTFIRSDVISGICGELKAPLGVYAVLGNHDNRDDRHGIWSALEAKGIRVLENDAVRIVRPGTGEGLWIAGVADDLSASPDLAGTFSKVTNMHEPVIAMAHNPASFIEHHDRYAVMLSGHLHGKQLRFPGRDRLQKLPSRAPVHYAYGHVRERERDLIVSSGLGTSSLPLRLNCPAEIVSLRIGPQPKG